jgi:hypothetical protein
MFTSILPIVWPPISPWSTVVYAPAKSNVNTHTSGTKAIESSTSGPMTLPAMYPKDTCTRNNTEKSTSAATVRIQKPAGRASIMARIICS